MLKFVELFYGLFILQLIFIKSDLDQFELIPNLLGLQGIDFHLVGNIEDVIEGQSILSHRNQFKKWHLDAHFIIVVFFANFYSLLFIKPIVGHVEVDSLVQRLLGISVCIGQVLLSDTLKLVKQQLRLRIRWDTDILRVCRVV